MISVTYVNNSHLIIYYTSRVVDDAKGIVVTSVCVCVCPWPHAYTIAWTRM